MVRNRDLCLLIPALASLLLTAGVLTIFTACGMKDDGTWMHCHSVQNAVAGCSVLLTVLFLAAALIRRRLPAAILVAAGAVLAAVTFALPGTIMPMCMMNTMRCYAVMQPFVRMMSVLILALALWGLLRTIRRGRQADPKAGRKR